MLSGKYGTSFFMSNNKKSGVHQATVVEFDGRVGKAYVASLDRTVRIHFENWMQIRDSWITEEQYKGPNTLAEGTQIVLMIGRRSWARCWGLAVDYTVPRHTKERAPWHAPLQQPAFA